MQITRNTVETTTGPNEWFTGTVYIDWAVGLDGVPDGYRAMNERETIKVMVQP